MKVAYLLGSLNRGGTETLLLDVFRNARYAEFDIIGVYRHEGAYLTDFQQTAVPFYYCPVRKGRLISYLYHLRKLLLQNNVQVVHAQQFIDCIYARLATLGTKIIVVETFHGYDFNASRLHRRLIALSIHLAHRVCFVSRQEKNYYLNAYHLSHDATDDAPSGKYQVVYNGISFDKFDHDFPEPDFLKKIDPPKAGLTRPRIAMVGNFVSGRSQSCPIRAIDLLNQQGINNFDFYFVGRRDEKDPWRYDDCVNYCQEHQLNHVHFLGGRSDVPAILQHLDAFVYSSDHDTFGIAVVEAMANGLPVLVNDWEVMREITRNGEWAMLFRSNDYDDCALAMKKLLENLPQLKSAAQSRAAQVRDEYSIQRHLQRLYQIYQLDV